jgi:cytochrome c oxidase subunit 2
MLALAVALARGRAARSTATLDSTLTRSVSLSVAISTMALIGLLFASVLTSRAIGSLSAPDALAIQITGYQWWWGIEYVSPEPYLRVMTANEIHLPVGRPVSITLKAADVIHSFWVPSLHGKTDLIPGRDNTTWVQVDAPGVFRGQCAEFCGVQHAHMALTVIAEPADQFEQWLLAERQLAPRPTTPDQSRGLQVVQQGPCALCHTIRGTTAAARSAPDLTHFASRSTIGAGTVPNTRDALGGWITDPQHLKPGNRMPATGLSAEDLQAVVAYLETLR